MENHRDDRGRSKDRKDWDDRDRSDRKISIRKTETIARDREYFNGNHVLATETTQKIETTQNYPTMHRIFPTVFQKWLRQQTEGLLAQEQKFECLYNIFSRDYKNKFVRSLISGKNW